MEVLFTLNSCYTRIETFDSIASPMTTTLLNKENIMNSHHLSAESKIMVDQAPSTDGIGLINSIYLFWGNSTWLQMKQNNPKTPSNPMISITNLWHTSLSPLCTFWINQPRNPSHPRHQHHQLLPHHASHNADLHPSQYSDPVVSAVALDAYTIVWKEKVSR